MSTTILCVISKIWWKTSHSNGPISRIPKCSSPISHNTPLLNRNVHISVTKWCIVGYGTGYCEIGLLCIYPVIHLFIYLFIHLFIFLPGLISSTDDKQRSRRESHLRLLSVSMSETEIKTLVTIPELKSRQQLISSRLLVLFIMLCILGAGVTVRLLVPIPETLPGDVTMVTSSDITTLTLAEVTTNNDSLSTLV